MGRFLERGAAESLRRLIGLELFCCCMCFSVDLVYCYLVSVCGDGLFFGILSFTYDLVTTYDLRPSYLRRNPHSRSPLFPIVWQLKCIS